MSLARRLPHAPAVARPGGRGTPASPPALADDHGHDPAWASGEALFKEGLALVEQAKVDGDLRKYEEARRKFLAAYDIVHRPNALFSVALTEKKLDRPADALHHFRRFLRDPAAEAKLVAQARKMVVELSPKVGTVQLEAPAGADIVVDGAPIGDKAPLADPVDLMPGKHILGARRDGESTERSVELTAGSAVALALEFPQAAPPPPSPASLVPLPPIASASPNEAPPATHPAPSSARTVVPLAVAGAGVVAAGIGVGFLAAAGSASSRAAGLNPQSLVCPQPPTSPNCIALSQDVRDQSNDKNIGIGLVAAGAVLVGGALATWLLWPKSSATASVTLAPVAWDHQAGAWLTGHF